jgi:hypothetical protein
MSLVCSCRLLSGDPLTAATVHRVHATLRAALNAAIREALIKDNPAFDVALPQPQRPHTWCGPRDGSLRVSTSPLSPSRAAPQHRDRTGRTVDTSAPSAR